MSKHHIQNLAEQIANKGHASAPFHNSKTTQQKSKVDAQSMVAADASSIQLRAYQLYQEKGGSAVDNWLEAERVLRNE